MLSAVTKKCNKCKKQKQISDFRIYHKKCGSYYCGDCKKCEAIYVHNNYHKNRKIKIAPVKDIPDEYWIDVIGYEGIYKISNKLRLKSLSKKVKAINDHSFRITNERIIKPSLMKNGYYNVSLCRNSSNKKFLFHRLLAIHFIYNPNNLPEINHKNGIKGDFSLNNLEWITTKENAIHKIDILGYRSPTGGENKLSKTILMISPNGEVEKIKGISEAARILGSPYSGVVSSVLSGRRNSYKGYKFQYIN